MKEINVNQKNAIKTISGPVLIIAGPGTGKTYTLVERVCHMVGDLKIDPSAIMISTFTNKAANELLDRLSIKFKDKGLNKDVNDMLLGNFHGICRRLLEENIDFLDFKKSFELIDDVEKKYLIYRNLDHFKKIPGYFNLITTRDVNEIDRLTKAVFEEGILDRKSENAEIQTIFDIVSLYEKILLNHNKMDFSAVLFYTYKLLRENAQVRDDLRNKISFIMVDEYQDTNTIQEKIIFSILNEEENICVVGDDDQGLYRFRGATVRNILNFQDKLKKKVQFIELDINYRSKKDIVDFYNGFIYCLDSFYDIEKYRYKKHLRAFNQDEAKAVFRIGARSEEEYRESVVDFIISLKENGKIKDYNQVAILVSSVNDPRILKLQTALRGKNIGVYTPRTSKLINKKEAKLVLGGLYGIFKPLMDKNKINLSYESFQFLVSAYNEIFKYENKDPMLKNYMGQMGKYLTSKKVNITILDIMYRFFRYEPFKSIFQDDRMEKSQKNISRMLELIDNFCKFEGLYYLTEANIDWFTRLFFDGFIGFIKNENVSEFEEDTIIPDKNQLSLLTIHASKGMEYPVVIMASLWDKPFKTYIRPFDKKINDFLASYGREDFEPYDYIEIFDFYRKYYTGFSRAQSLLVLAGIEGKEAYKQIGIELKPFFSKLDDIGQEEISKLEINLPKESSLKNIYSYTGDLAQYEYCPRAYKFFRKLKFSRSINYGMVYGSLVHETIEYINKALIREKTPSDMEIYESLRNLAKGKYLSGARFIDKDMLDRAYEEVLKYKSSLGDFGNILDSELGISLALEDYILIGNIDMIYEKDGLVKIIDFKTGRNPQEVGKEDLLDRYIGQLYLYANLYERSKDQSIDQVSLYFTSPENAKDLVSLDIDQDKLADKMAHVDELIKKIEGDQTFSKTENIDRCKTCELRFYCGRI